MKKTKIVCTIGPATNDVEKIRVLISKGMNIARINGSHGTKESNKEIIKNIKAASDNIPILLDIPGTKVRLGNFSDPIEFRNGDTLIFTTDKAQNEGIPIDHTELHRFLEAGDILLIDDGTLKFEVIKIENKKITCKALCNGILKERKGINLPTKSFRGSALTEKDKELIRYAIENDLDFIGLSFVENKDQVLEAHKFLGNTKLGGDKIKIIAKIETKNAIINHEEIIEAADGILIDRGDLGSETLPELVPKLQKEIIKACNKNAKPVIVATNMLESMITKHEPTKAEISDIANAVLDGASALMLSAETASGDFPIEATQYMNKVIENIEEHINIENEIKSSNSTDEICNAVANIVKRGSINKVICFTSAGYNARKLASYKLNTPVIALTPNIKTSRQLHLYWGVNPKLTKIINSLHDLQSKKEIVQSLVNENILEENDRIIIIASIAPNPNERTTNHLEIHNIKDLLNPIEMEELEKWKN